MQTCDNCGGEGGFYTPDAPPSKWVDPTPGERWDECPTCLGSGWVRGDAPQIEMGEAFEPLSDALLDRARDLVGSIDVDLDAPIEGAVAI